MLFQFVLAFGHVLGLDEHAPASSHSALSLQQTAPDTSGDPAGLPDDGCPICLTLHMAASGVLPSAPLVALPDRLVPPYQQAVVRFDVVAPRHASFQTRAPPSA